MSNSKNKPHNLVSQGPSKEEKEQRKKEEKAEKTRRNLKYHDPHVTYNYHRVSLYDMLEGIRGLASDPDTIFTRLADNNDYLVIRLERSPRVEDGLLTYWRRSNLYLVIYGVKHHGLYRMGSKRVMEEATFVGSVAYDGKSSSDIHIGMKHFKSQLDRLIYEICNKKDNFKSWGSYIQTLMVFLPEAVRNELVYQALCNKKAEVLSNPYLDIIQDYKKLSVCGYDYNPKDGFELGKADKKLIRKLQNPGVLSKYENRKLQEKLRENGKVCRLMFKVPYDHLAVDEYWPQIRDLLRKQSKNLDKIYDLIELKVKEDEEEDEEEEKYTMTKGQLRCILWGLVDKELLLYENKNELYRLNTYKKKAVARDATTSGAATTTLKMAQKRIADSFRTHTRV